MHGVWAHEKKSLSTVNAYTLGSVFQKQKAPPKQNLFKFAFLYSRKAWKQTFCVGGQVGGAWVEGSRSLTSGSSGRRKTWGPLGSTLPRTLLVIRTFICKANVQPVFTGVNSNGLQGAVGLHLKHVIGMGKGDFSQEHGHPWNHLGPQN